MFTATPSAHDIPNYAALEQVEAKDAAHGQEEEKDAAHGQAEGNAAVHGQEEGKDEESPTIAFAAVATPSLLQEKKERFEELNENGVLIKEWVRGKLLGKGGFAAVYEVRERSLKAARIAKTYAIKVVEKASLDKESSLKRYERELALHRTISHAHIVKFQHHFQTKDLSFIIMDFCERGSLSLRLRARRLQQQKFGLPEEEVRTFPGRCLL